MSQSLIWHIIRDNNSFMVKRERTSRAGAVQFSSEPGNLLNAHSFKYSGLANNRAIDISTDMTIRSKVQEFSCVASLSVDDAFSVIVLLVARIHHCFCTVTGR
jgi:hypothetical protein